MPMLRTNVREKVRYKETKNVKIIIHREKRTRKMFHQSRQINLMRNGMGIESEKGKRKKEERKTLIMLAGNFKISKKS